MRVYVIEFVGRGGMIHYAYQLCQALATQGFEVKLITDQDYELAALPHEFPVERLFRLWDARPAGPIEWSNTVGALLKRLSRRGKRAFLYYRAWWCLIRYLRHERPDVAQFGEIRFPIDLFPLLLLRISGINISDVCHNVATFDARSSSSSLIKTSFVYRFVYQYIYRCFFAIFVHSKSSLQEFIDIYDFQENKLHVIPHGNENLFVDSNASVLSISEIRRKFTVDEKAQVVLFFGALTKYKGIEYLIDAFVRIKEVLSEARLLISGYPNPQVDINALHRRVGRLGIEESVIFHLEYIPTDQVAALFSIADVVVFPYVAIYQSGAVQVAYSFGKPVVATSVGGLPEVVEHGSSGLLVPPRDPERLAEAIITLLRDSRLAKKMGDRARELSSTVYSWDHVAKKIGEVYSLNNPRKEPR